MFLSNVNEYGFTMFTYGSDTAGYFLNDWGSGGLCGSDDFVSLLRGIVGISGLELFVLFNVLLDGNSWLKLWVLKF